MMSFTQTVNAPVGILFFLLTVILPFGSDSRSWNSDIVSWNSSSRSPEVRRCFLYSRCTAFELGVRVHDVSRVLLRDSIFFLLSGLIEIRVWVFSENSLALGFLHVYSQQSVVLPVPYL
ncbi:hypothetical protein F5Y18DRAFT_346827 [Xylariaceae sp. FL1019]|nr:hypothetical protein F5Y18DRAFT_346827 [Xylariaceae sp. FL1019]